MCTTVKEGHLVVYAHGPFSVGMDSASLWVSPLSSRLFQVLVAPHCRSCQYLPSLMTNTSDLISWQFIYFLISQICVFSFTPTYSNRISGQSQLADDVTRNVCFHQMTLLGVVLCCLQQMVKLLRVKLLEESKFDSWSHQAETFGVCSLTLHL